MHCIYCESSDLKTRTIAENDLAWSFPTNTPIVPGHVLVVPKRCVARFDDLTLEEKLAIEEIRGKIIIALRKEFQAEGFNYAWNEARLAGQSVPHFHLHIVPRKEGDVGIYEYEPRKFLYRPGSREETPVAELASVANQIATAIRDIIIKI